MTRHITRIARCAVGVLSILAVLAVPARAGEETMGEEMADRVEKETQERTAGEREKIVEEATAAIRETENALRALDEKQPEEALAALERATGKLELILARRPELAFAPYQVAAATYDLIADVETVKRMTREAVKLLEDGRIQDARAILEDLRSETVISVASIPLATYPVAIKAAARLIDQDRTEDAKRTLQTALNTLVVTDTVVPLPVATARKMLEEAETLTEKENRTADENERLARLLEEARHKLEFAQELGYGDEEDYDVLYEEIESIEEKSGGGKTAMNLYEKIKSSLSRVLMGSKPEAGR